MKWLRPQAGPMVAARRKLGDAKHKPVEPAPGRYAKERV
jgi:polyhydroxyalkanoate synthase